MMQADCTFQTTVISVLHSSITQSSPRDVIYVKKFLNFLV